ncbi:MAG: hypothetical protein JSV58_06795 [Candidatus Bathyarchaeota archaeon]|nr:MAG: hypothetical protein JSV58_06795 [Candidatus Bathyarchaeota archaeon]
MKFKRIAVTFFGIVQEIMGVLAVVFAYILYYNVLEVRANLGLLPENVSIYLLLLFVFGFVSFINGLFLFYQRLENGGSSVS